MHPDIQTAQLDIFVCLVLTVLPMISQKIVLKNPYIWVCKFQLLRTHALSLNRVGSATDWPGDAGQVS